MSFNATAINIGTTNTLVFECPALLNGSIHGLVISNVSAATASLTLRFHDNSEGTTTVIRNVDVPAKGEFVFPKPINVSPGDKVIASSSASGALVALNSVYLSDVTPIAKSLNPRGVWFDVASYETLDVVYLDGRSYLATGPSQGEMPPGGNWMILADRGIPSGVHTVHGVEPGEDNDVVLPEATAEASGVMSAEDKAKLDGVAEEATKNETDAHLLARGNHTGTQGIETIEGLEEELDLRAPLDSPAFTGTVMGITQDMVGLGEVDNTPDLDKPISAATQAALSGKVDKVEGKQLSAEDFSTTLKDKLDNIEAGAQVNPDIVDNLTSDSAVHPLSANQGRALKGMVDSINTLLQSDDSTLDELQEIVDFIKLNREDLEELNINSIAGLVDALGEKQPTLVSGGNIKTVNGNPILGEGNIDVGTLLDASFTDDFTAEVNKAYWLAGDYNVTLPSDPILGNSVTFAKSYEATPKIHASAGTEVVTEKGASESVVFDVNAEITFVFNGTDWEL